MFPTAQSSEFSAGFMSTMRFRAAQFRMSARLACAVVLLFLGVRHAPAQDSALETQYAAAQRAMAEGRYAEAQRAYESLVQSNPNVAELHANLGVLYFQQKMYEQSVRELRRALQLKPGLSKSAAILAMSQSELGKYSEALPGLEKGFHSSDPDIKRMCGLQLERAYTGLKRDNNAVEMALELGRLYPDDPEVLYHNGKIFGNFAFLTMQRLWAAPDSVWKHQAEGEAFESQGAFEEAIGQYHDVLARDPRRPGIHYRLGRVLLSRSRKTGSAEDLSAAAKEFQQELEIDPTHANSAYELGEIDRGAGQLKDAQRYFEMALKYYPDFEEAHQGLAATLLALQQPEPAAEHLKRAIGLDPGNEVSWWRLSQAERALGNAEEQKKALAEFQRLHSKPKAQEHEADRNLFSSDEVTEQKVDPASAQ